jgi:Zn finger protein HypA/HybF involved in hydrogenase expression
MEKKGTSWGWIIFWLIIFWPVGLFLVIKKVANDKSVLMSGKTGALPVVGCILIVIGAVGAIGTIANSSDGAAGAIIMGLAMVVGGILLLQKSSKMKKTAAKYKKYIDIIVNQNVRSIDNIAASIGLSYDVAAKDLQDMINIGYLKDAYVNQGNREIVFKQNEPAAYLQATEGQANAQKIAVRCPGCGANNVVVVGRVSECEYCGTPINA